MCQIRTINSWMRGAISSLRSDWMMRAVSLTRLLSFQRKHHSLIKGLYFLSLDWWKTSWPGPTDRSICLMTTLSPSLTGMSVLGHVRSFIHLLKSGIVDASQWELAVLNLTLWRKRAFWRRVSNRSRFHRHLRLCGFSRVTRMRTYLTY